MALSASMSINNTPEVCPRNSFSAAELFIATTLDIGHSGGTNESFEETRQEFSWAEVMLVLYSRSDDDFTVVFDVWELIVRRPWRQTNNTDVVIMILFSGLRVHTHRVAICSFRPVQTSLCPKA